MTMTEKIIANHSDSSVVRPGSNIWTRVDKLMTHDVCGPGTFGIFQKEFGENAEVWDRERVVLMPDHYIFTSDERANRNVDILRDMAKRYNIKYFYDITDRSDFRANPDYKGVCHVALAQEGHCKPGEVMFGTDSHTCNAGAFGQFATGVGNTDAGFILGTGKLLIKVPPTMRFEMVGQMPPYLLAKDLILHIIGEISVAGGTYRAMEFSGEAISNMSMEERMTICNMVIEAGGKNGEGAGGWEGGNGCLSRRQGGEVMNAVGCAVQAPAPAQYCIEGNRPPLSHRHVPPGRDNIRLCHPEDLRAL